MPQLMQARLKAVLAAFSCRAREFPCQCNQTHRKSRFFWAPRVLRCFISEHEFHVFHSCSTPRNLPKYQDEDPRERCSKKKSNALSEQTFSRCSSDGAIIIEAVDLFNVRNLDSNGYGTRKAPHFSEDLFIELEPGVECENGRHWRLL